MTIGFSMSDKFLPKKARQQETNEMIYFTPRILE
jgi:hypothetical protein